MEKESSFKKARNVEAAYARSLRSVAREVSSIIKRYGTLTLSNIDDATRVLARYAEIIKPWAEARAAKMIAEANRADLRAWNAATESAGRALREEIFNTPIGVRVHQLMNEQVALITSLPLKAAERVHELVLKNVETSGRGSDIEREIKRSGEVTASRAKTIARTEVARASSVLTQARAEHVGAEGYIWQTVHDSDVRPSHRKMAGKFVRWDNPPTLDGLTGHAGQLPNCRCFADPVIPRELFDEE